MKLDLKVNFLNKISYFLQSNHADNIVFSKILWHTMVVFYKVLKI